MIPDFFDADNLQWMIVGVLGLVAVSMFMIIRFVQKVVMKVTLLAVFAGLGLSLWVQRADLGDCVQTCECSLYGRDVVVTYEQLPAAVRTKIDAGSTDICPGIVRPD